MGKQQPLSIWGDRSCASWAIAFLKGDFADEAPGWKSKTDRLRQKPCTPESLRQRKGEVLLSSLNRASRPRTTRAATDQTVSLRTFFGASRFAIYLLIRQIFASARGPEQSDALRDGRCLILSISKRARITFCGFKLFEKNGLTRSLFLTF